MYNHLLVPIVFDHGTRGADAIKIARQLMAEGGTITLLHVMEAVPSYASSYLPEGLADQHKKDALSGLEEIAKAANVACETAVIHGHSYTSILEYGNTHKADCIVIASHKPGFEDYFLGSTAARVVRHAKCGVHILR
ncbi:MAG: universal stress protein [Roseobacter sp.]